MKGHSPFIIKSRGMAFVLYRNAAGVAVKRLCETTFSPFAAAHAWMASAGCAALTRPRLGNPRKHGRMVRKDVALASNSSFSISHSTFEWDGWNIIRETTSDLSTSQPFNHSTTQTDNVWGLDLDGTLQGAGGVGGLLAVVRDDGTFLPTYDANGNISEYVNASDGTIAAHYDYSPFGEILIQTGDLANTFTHHFSTKPYCPITKLVEYQLRKYRPEIWRWMSRDPIGEDGGSSLYVTCANILTCQKDYIGTISVTELPNIMRSKGWDHGAQLMELWFSQKASDKASTNTDTMKMEWVLKFARAKDVYDEIVREKIYANDATKHELSERIKASMPSMSGRFCDLGRDVVEIDKDYINYRAVGSISDPLDDMMASLGRFTFRMAASANVKHISSKRTCVAIDAVGIYVRDSYDFTEDQMLGYWKSETNYVGRNPIRGERVSNRDFRNYREQTGMGLDFIVYSDVKIVPVEPTIVFTFSSSE